MAGHVCCITADPLHVWPTGLLTNTVHDTNDQYKMSVPAPELQLHLAAGETAATTELVGYVKANGAPALEVRAWRPLLERIPIDRRRKRPACSCRGGLAATGDDRLPELLTVYLFFVQADKLVESLKGAIENAGTLAARETGLNSVATLCKEFGVTVAPYLTPLLPSILTAYADKVRFSDPAILTTLFTLRAIAGGTSAPASFVLSPPNQEDLRPSVFPSSLPVFSLPV